MSEIQPKEYTLRNGQSATVRSAKSEDAQEILYFAKDVFSTSQFLLTEPDEFTNTLEQERAWVESYAPAPGKLLLLALSRDLVVGMLNFDNAPRRRMAHTGTFGMSVREGWRGLGVGSAMLQELIAWGQAHPFLERLELSYFEGNEPAQALYEKMGFQMEGRKVRAFRLADGTYRDEILMCRFV